MPAETSVILHAVRQLVKEHKVLSTATYVARTVSLCGTTMRHGVPLRIVPDVHWEHLRAALKAVDEVKGL